MPDFVVDRVLLTNDDGIDAPGIKLLENVAITLAREVWVVAPERDQSGVSHSLSLHDALRVSDEGPRRFRVSGTPGDCVVIAVQELMNERRPDLILSGVNRGSNLGVETVFSGTVGAAMTGMLLGFKSIALSQALTPPNPVSWDTSSAFASSVIRRLARMEWPEDCCLNVNFPELLPAATTSIEFTEQGPGLMQGLNVSKRTDLRNNEYYWLNFRRGPVLNPPGSETAVVLGGGISVTPLQFERTNWKALSSLGADRTHLAHP